MKGTTIYIGVLEGEETDIKIDKSKLSKVHDLGLFAEIPVKDFTPEKYKEFISKISEAVWKSMQDGTVATLAK